MKLGVGMNKLDVSFGERERKITGIQLGIEPGPSNYNLTSNWKVLGSIPSWIPRILLSLSLSPKLTSYLHSCMRAPFIDLSAQLQLVSCPDYISLSGKKVW